MQVRSINRKTQRYFKVIENNVTNEETDSEEEIDIEERVITHEGRLNIHYDLIKKLSSFIAFRASGVENAPAGSSSDNRNPGILLSNFDKLNNNVH